MVLFTASRGNTFVGGTCALLSALLVSTESATQCSYDKKMQVMEMRARIEIVGFQTVSCISSRQFVQQIRILHFMVVCPIDLIRAKFSAISGSAAKLPVFSVQTKSLVASH